MAVQYVETRPGQTFGQSLGENLGLGLQGALKTLAQLKLNEYQQRQQLANQQKSNLAGLNALFEPEHAQALSNLSPELLKPVITEKVRGQRAIEDLGPGLNLAAPELTPDEASKLAKMPKSVQGLWYKNYLQSPSQAIKSLRKIPDAFQSTDVKDFAQTNLNELRNELNQQPQEQIQKPITEAQKITEQPKKMEEKLKPVFNKPKTYEEYQKEGLTKEESKELLKSEIKETAEENKNLRKLKEDTLHLGDNTDQIDKRLDRFTKLINEGSLPIAEFYNLFNRLSESDIKTHIPIIGPLVDLIANTALQATGEIGKSTQRRITATDTEEFEKLTQDFVRQAKEIYGGRITNFELEQFLKTIPSLSQTDNGKRAVIRNLKNFSDALKIKGKAMKKIMKETGGKIPSNLRELLDQETKTDLDRLAKEFIEGIDKSNKENNIQLPIQNVFGQAGEL